MANQKITADEFERQYAARSDMTVDELRAQGRVVRPCNCDDPNCQGWMSVNERSYEEDQRFRHG